MVTMRALSLLAVMILATSCGLFTKTSIERTTWDVTDVDGNEVELSVQHGSECESLGDIVVDEGAEVVRIQAFLEIRQGWKEICAGIGTGTTEVVSLEAPLGDRHLIGCTYDSQGVEPQNIDCRRWPGWERDGPEWEQRGPELKRDPLKGASSS